MSSPDKLDEIFRMQDLLNKKIGVDLANLSPDEKTKWALNYSRAMSQELAELIDSFLGNGGPNTRRSTSKTPASRSSTYFTSSFPWPRPWA